jgi:hypothetical protein
MLAEELAAGMRDGRASEWLEEVLVTVLLDVIRGERERCAAVADRRVELWSANERKMASGTWPADARFEARERRKEAIVLADALRAG